MQRRGRQLNVSMSAGSYRDRPGCMRLLLLELLVSNACRCRLFFLLATLDVVLDYAAIVRVDRCRKERKTAEKKRIEN